MITTSVKPNLTIGEFRKYWAALNSVARNRKNSLPVLNCVLVEYERGESEIAITATDLDRFLTVRVPYDPTDKNPDYISSWSALIESDKITKALVKKKASSELSFCMDGIIIDSILYEIRSHLEEGDFPDVSVLGNTKPTGNALTVSPNELVKAGKYASTDEGRYALSGVHVTPKFIEASDGKRLIQIKSHGGNGEVVIPGPAVDLIGKLSFAMPDLGYLQISERSVVRYASPSKDFVLLFRVMDDTYPNTSKVIPDHELYESYWDVSDVDTVRQFLSGFTDKETLLMNLRGTQCSLALYKNKNGAEGVKKIASRVWDLVVGLDVSISFNPVFIAGCLEDVSILHIRDELSPLVGLSEDGRTKVVIMPLRTQCTQSTK